MPGNSCEDRTNTRKVEQFMLEVGGEHQMLKTKGEVVGGMKHILASMIATTCFLTCVYS